MCGHNADGAEWTYRTPLVALRVAVLAVTVTSSISGARCAFPSGLVEEGSRREVTRM
jgi:hypothetical protein